MAESERRALLDAARLMGEIVRRQRPAPLEADADTEPERLPEGEARRYEPIGRGPSGPVRPDR